MVALSRLQSLRVNGDVRGGKPGKRVRAIQADGPRLAETKGFRAVTGNTRNPITSLVFLDPNQLLRLGADTGLGPAGALQGSRRDLAKVRAMNVIARSTVARFTGTALNLREIAESLNVGSVLEGTVRYAGDKVRIGVQLVNPETQLSLWAEQYDRDLADVFAIQSDIARRIAQALEARLLPGGR